MEVRSWRPARGWSATAAYMIGAPGKKRGRRRAAVFSTCSGSKRGSSSWVMPAMSEKLIATVRP